VDDLRANTDQMAEAVEANTTEQPA
jgi:hypothetical protein